MISRQQIWDQLARLSLWLFVGQLGLIVGIETVYIAVFSGAEDFSTTYKNAPLEIIGLATSMYPISAGLGSFSIVFLAHAIREITILSISVYLWLVGYLVGSLLVGNIGALMAARIIKGTALGMMTSVLPLYVEHSTKSKHAAARLLTLFQTTVPLGMLLMAIVANFAPSPSYSTRWIQAAIPVFPAAGLLFCLPQSSQGSVIQKEDQEPGCGSAWAKVKRDFLKLKRSRHHSARCAAACFVQCAGSVTGASIIIYHATIICMNLGFSSDIARYIALGVYGLNFVGTATSLTFIAKLPRLPTLQYSLLAIGAIHYVIFDLQILQKFDSDNAVLKYVSLGLLLALILVYSLLFAGASLVYTSEVVSEKTRSISLSIAIATGWLCSFIVSLITLPILKCYVFLLLGILCCVLFPVFAFIKVSSISDAHHKQIPTHN